MAVNASLYTAEHEDFRAAVRTFIGREVSPHLERWDEQRRVDRETWIAAGKQGLLGIAVPEEFGGAGIADIRYRAVIAEEIARAGATSFGAGIGLQDDIVIPYLLNFASPEQKSRWLPGMCSGEIIGAIAMTEPGTGSDLQNIRTSAVQDGDEWVINGAKTFITSGILSDLVIVAARTSPADQPPTLGLFVVERGTPGFERGRQLHKIGLTAQDTAELVFTGVRVPAANVLGDPTLGFFALMENLPLERLAIAIAAAAACEAAVHWATEYVHDRTAFGRRIIDQQHTQFRLAELSVETEVTRAYVNAAIQSYNAGTLTATDAARAKLWAAEAQKRVVDACLQFFGGYGYMLEYPIARSYVDTRVQTIYGGTSEIMKLIIGREIRRKP